MSVERPGHRDLVAGFLCAFSLALSGVALTRNPGLLASVAVVVALVALRMSESRQRLAAVAVGVAGVAFFLGMVIAVVTANPLY
jgi:pilus assembly protein TadC